MGIYVFTRDVLLRSARRATPASTSAASSFPRRSTRYRVVAHLHDGYWADVGTVQSFYDANIMLTRPSAPFSFYDPRRPIYTHARFLPPSRVNDCTLDATRWWPRGATSTRPTSPTRSSASARTIGGGARLRRSVLLGADYYDAHAAERPPAASRSGIGRAWSSTA